MFEIQGWNPRSMAVEAPVYMLEHFQWFIDSILKIYN